MPGFWKRPIGRVYSYNLDLGESYYSPMSNYIDSPQRQIRDESPGPLTYSERLASRWLEGNKDREWRAQTEAREYGRPARSGVRAGSEFRTTVQTPKIGLPPLPPSRRQWRDMMADHQRQEGEDARQSVQQADMVLNAHRQNMSDAYEDSYRRTFTAPGRAEDDIYKRMVDIRMSPWRGTEIQKEMRMAQESRGRMSSLERELDSVTRSAMTYRPAYGKSARQLAEEAAAEQQMSSSTRRTRNISMESSRQFY